MSNGDAPARGRRRWFVPVLAVAALLLLVLAERAVPWLRNRGPDASGRALWLWSQDDPYGRSPVDFYALRDFDLAAPLPHARLLVAADQEYIAYVNGERVGSNQWVLGASLDAYDVGPLLKAGRNRLALELRSATGIGGFVARLEEGMGGRDLVWTDPQWRIHQLLTNELLTDGNWPEGDAPVVWGRSPVGRWNSPRAAAVRPLYGELVTGQRGLVPESFRVLDRKGEWRPWAEWEKLERRPSQVVFDWGREVSGYLAIRFRRSDARVGLGWFGAVPPEPRREEVADAVVMSVEGRGAWRDAVPRRFRYVALVGLHGLQQAQVLPLDEASLARLTPAPQRGVFGITPPPLRAPVEDEVWRELQGLAGRTPREGG